MSQGALPYVGFVQSNVARVQQERRDSEIVTDKLNLKRLDKRVIIQEADAEDTVRKNVRLN